MTIQKKQTLPDVTASLISGTASELYKKCPSMDAVFEKWDSRLTQCYHLAKKKKNPQNSKNSLFIFLFCFLLSLKQKDTYTVEICGAQTHFNLSINNFRF